MVSLLAIFLIDGDGVDPEQRARIFIAELPKTMIKIR